MGPLEPETSSRMLGAARVLVVDDNAANRLLAQQTLEDEGYQVATCDGGQQALDEIQARLPDCILLDVRMPGLDGFAVCERIRQMPHGADMPVIFLTALRDVDTFDQALRAGADDFLTKPVRPTELVIRVRAALKLRELRSELHDHYALLKSQRDALMRLQLQKERLIAFLVHDLKNPVSAMDLHAQVLLLEHGLSQDGHDSATQIRSKARQLDGMIGNLLDISKAEEGRLILHCIQVDLGHLLRELSAEFALVAEIQKVRLSCGPTSITVFADPALLRRTLSNLVDNAIRHTPEGGLVTVHADREAQATTLSVHNTGASIPQAMRGQIFDPFVQLASPRQALGARGLGLTFCKVAVEAHGGTIWVADGAPGARFCVRLPDVIG